MKISELLLYEMARGIPWKPEENEILVDKYLKYQTLALSGERPRDEEGSIISGSQYINAALGNKGYIRSERAINSQIDKLKKSPEYQSRLEGSGIYIPWKPEENEILVDKYLKYDELVNSVGKPRDEEGKIISLTQYISAALGNKGYIRSEPAINTQIYLLKKSPNYQSRLEGSGTNIPWTPEENEILVDKYLKYDELVNSGERPRDENEKIIPVYQYISTKLADKGYIRSEPAINSQIDKLKKSPEYQSRLEGIGIHIPWTPEKNEIVVDKYLEYSELANSVGKPRDEEGKIISLTQYISAALAKKGHSIRNERPIHTQIDKLKKSPEYQSRLEGSGTNIPWTPEENEILVDKYLEYDELANSVGKPRDKEKNIISIYQYISAELADKGYSSRSETVIRSQIYLLKKSPEYQSRLEGIGKKLRYKDDEIDNMKTLFADGFVFGAIARQLKRSRQGVVRFLQRQPDYASLLDQHRRNLKIKINIQETNFLNNIENKLKQLMQAGTIQSYELVKNNKEIKSPELKKPYQIDGILTVSTQERPIFLEYFGGPWHADPKNPRYFEPEGQLSKSSKRTFDQKRKHDINKFNFLTTQGIPVFIWDRECNFGQNIEKCWPQIENAIINGQPYFDQVTNAT